MKKILIGIDPGRHTGLAVIKDGKLVRCETMMIHEAMKELEGFGPDYVEYDIHVVVEDARKRSGKPEAAQGAGAVKRDSSIWEDFLTDLKISFKMVPPRKNGTRFRDEIFWAKYPYWQKRTSVHSRSAANLLI